MYRIGTRTVHCSSRVVTSKVRSPARSGVTSKSADSPGPIEEARGLPYGLLRGEVGPVLGHSPPIHEPVAVAQRHVDPPVGDDMDHPKPVALPHPEAHRIGSGLAVDARIGAAGDIPAQKDEPLMLRIVATRRSTTSSAP